MAKRVNHSVRCAEDHLSGRLPSEDKPKILSTDESKPFLFSRVILNGGQAEPDTGIGVNHEVFILCQSSPNQWCTMADDNHHMVTRRGEEFICEHCDKSGKCC